MEQNEFKNIRTRYRRSKNMEYHMRDERENVLMPRGRSCEARRDIQTCLDMALTLKRDWIIIRMKNHFASWMHND